MLLLGVGLRLCCSVLFFRVRVIQELKALRVYRVLKAFKGFKVSKVYLVSMALMV